MVTAGCALNSEPSDCEADASTVPSRNPSSSAITRSGVAPRRRRSRACRCPGAREHPSSRSCLGRSPSSCSLDLWSVFAGQSVTGWVESFGEEPDREDQLEEAAWGNSKQPGALCHVGYIEHVQDATNQQHRIADEPEDCDRARDQL